MSMRLAHTLLGRVYEQPDNPWDLDVNDECHDESLSAVLKPLVGKRVYVAIYVIDDE